MAKFPDIVETPPWSEFHAVMSYDYGQGTSFQQKFPEFVRLVLEAVITVHTSQLVQGVWQKDV